MDIIKEQFKASDIELFLTSGGPEDVLAADTTLYPSAPSQSESSFKTLINDQPKNLGGHTLTFKFAQSGDPFVYNGIVIKDFYNGTIVITTNDPTNTNGAKFHFENQNVHGIEIVNTHCDIIFENIQFQYTTYGGSYDVIRFDHAMGNNYMNNCFFSNQSGPTDSYTIYAAGCFVKVSNIVFVGSYRAIFADNAVIHTKNLSNYYPHSIGVTYSLIAIRGGVISREGAYFSSISGYYTASGGTIR